MFVSFALLPLAAASDVRGWMTGVLFEADNLELDVLVVVSKNGFAKRGGQLPATAAKDAAL